MKKVLMFMAIMIAVVFSSASFTSCSSDEERETSFGFLKDTYMTIVGRSGRVSFVGDASSWNSSNNFVASVSSDGIITANHVGTCEITASSDRRSAKCTINVEPIYDTYIEPLTIWGTTRAEVKAYEKRQIVKEDERNIYFGGDGKYVAGLSYSFNNEGKLHTVMVLIKHDQKPSVAKELAEFFKERYRVISVSASDSFFSNGNDKESSSTFVDVRINQRGYEDYMFVYYTRYNF